MNLKLILVISLIVTVFIGCDNVPNKEATEKKTEFKDLGEEEGFAEKHDEPESIDFNESGKMLKVAVKGDDDATIYSLTNSNSDKYVIVLHEWWGLNDHIKQAAEKMYEKLGNTNVIALDLYDGKVASTREKATEYMKGADENRINSIIAAVIETLPENAEVATIGWCFGGGWSLKTAIALGNKAKACIIYYGMPTEEIEELQKLETDVLFIYGINDKWISTEVANQFEKNMIEAGKKVEVIGFNADHAFANPSSENYAKPFAKKANSIAFKYLKNKLK